MQYNIFYLKAGGIYRYGHLRNQVFTGNLFFQKL